MKKLFVLAALLVLVGVGAFAQATDTDSHPLTITIDPVYVIELNDNATSVDLAVAAPAVAGDPVTVSPADTTKRLFYTVLRQTAPLGGASVTVTLAPAVGDDIPTGLSLTISTAAPESGTAGAPIVYTTGDAKLNNPQAFFDIDSSVATGQGVGDGAPITYTLALTGGALAVTAAQSFTVTYTITAS